MTSGHQAGALIAAVSLRSLHVMACVYCQSGCPDPGDGTRDEPVEPNPGVRCVDTRGAGSREWAQLYDRFYDTENAQQ